MTTMTVMRRATAFLALALALAGCRGKAPEGEAGPAARIDVEAPAFKALMERPGTVLVDVREPAELADQDGRWPDGQIEGAINLPWTSGVFAATFAERFAPGDTVLIYCRSGRRSGLASSLMAEAGYPHVFNLVGGINAWPYGSVPQRP